jgi:hypothetical protein
MRSAASCRSEPARGGQVVAVEGLAVAGVVQVLEAGAVAGGDG